MNSFATDVERALLSRKLSVRFMQASLWLICRCSVVSIALLLMTAGKSWSGEPAIANSIEADAVLVDAAPQTDAAPAEAEQTAPTAVQGGNVDASLTTPEQVKINTKATYLSGSEAPASLHSATTPRAVYVIDNTSNLGRQQESLNSSDSALQDALGYTVGSTTSGEIRRDELTGAPEASVISPITTAEPPADPRATRNSATLAQVTPDPSTSSSREALGIPYLRLQGAYLLQGDESSARARLTAFYPVAPSLGFGAEVDLTTGDAFADSRSEGLNINELYVTAAIPDLPNLRFVGGQLDLTSYFDRNSFAKDGTTHFFNPVFQTNPALSAASIASRPALLLNWSVTDNLELKAATFSSSRDLDEFELNAFAGEIGLRFGTAIVRGTYVSAEDAGSNDGFEEIFGIDRDGSFGVRSGDREESYGLNAEVFIPELNLGIFGRYGHYENRELDEGGDTFSFGINLLDLFMADDRLGLAYGQRLSNDELREGETPDVLELFYDARLTPNLRAGVTLQGQNEFSDWIAGFRLRADFDASELLR